MIARRLLRGLLLTLSALFVVAVVAGIAFCGIVATRPLPTVTATPANVPTTQPVALHWTRPSSVAVGTLEAGLKARAGDLGPRPTASIAKVITVLVVASVRPLGAGEDGPTYTITADDIARLNDTLAHGGSFYPVTAGQVWTQRQILSAILLVSANNLADSYAIWAFGSLAAYHDAATAWLAAHGLHQTTVGPDASGIDPSTTSTTADLFELGRIFLRDPGLSSIASLAQAQVPDGTIENTDPLVSHDGYVGVKTGTLTPAGYCLLVANRQTIAGVDVVVIGVVLNETDAVARNQSARDLVNFALANLVSTDVRAGQAFGYATDLDGHLMPLVATSGVTGVRWRDEPVTVIVDVPPAGLSVPLVAGRVMGSVMVQGQTIPLLLVGEQPVPDMDWRLTHLDRLAWCGSPISVIWPGRTACP